MSSQVAFSFIIVDDDKINNMVCHRLINHVSPESDVKLFSDPFAGLDYLKSFTGPKAVETILLLDINMPGMTGWQFMEHFERLAAKEYIRVYILSSSVNKADKQKAAANQTIVDYIVKPLDPQTVRDIIRSVAR